MNQFETVVHHTVDDRDNADYVENHAPFPVQNVNEAYLGFG